MFFSIPFSFGNSIFILHSELFFSEDNHIFPELVMNEPNKIPDFSYINKRREEARRIRRKVSVDEIIQRDRTTLLINLLIEILAGLILFAGIIYTAYFLTIRRSALTFGQYKLYIGVLAFFSVGWFTYVASKVRKKYLLYREYSKKPDLSDDDDIYREDDCPLS